MTKDQGNALAHGVSVCVCAPLKNLVKVSSHGSVLTHTDDSCTMHAAAQESGAKRQQEQPSWGACAQNIWG